MSGFSDEALGQMTDEEVFEYYTIIEVIHERQQKALEGKKSG